jgi:hypothetical protein
MKNDKNETTRMTPTTETINCLPDKPIPNLGSSPVPKEIVKSRRPYCPMLRFSPEAWAKLLFSGSSD